MCPKESYFPDYWKVSLLVSVFKNVDERFTAKNYSLVSLLSVVSKVFEKLVNNKIIDHLKKCGHFSDSQYGFRSFWSTVDLLAVISDRIARVFDRSGATQAVAPDISKAFDRIWHAGLLHKRKSYGIAGQIFGFQSFPYKNHCDCFFFFTVKKLASTLWSVLFTLTYFFTYTLLFCSKIKSCVVIAVFHSKLDSRPLFKYIDYKIILVWTLVSVWITNATHCLPVHLNMLSFKQYGFTQLNKVYVVISDCNWTRTHSQLVYKQTLSHLAQLAKWLSCVVSTYLYGAIDRMFLSCHVCISEWIHTL